MSTARFAADSQFALLAASVGQPGARLSNAALMVAYAPPSAKKAQASQIAGLVTYTAESNVTAKTSDIVVLIAYATGVPDAARSRAWTFSLDGHQFYVLNLGLEGTWVYDQITNQWCTFETDGYGQWNVTNGTMWGNTRIVGGDLLTDYVWEVDPAALLDMGWKDIEHVVTGGIATRSRTSIGCDSIRLNASVGLLDEVNGTTMSLRFSDDQGVSWSDYFVLTLTENDFNAEIAWRSLGSFAAPGRVFEISDVGGTIRIDGADAMLNGFDNDQQTQE